MKSTSPLFLFHWIGLINSIIFLIAAPAHASVIYVGSASQQDINVNVDGTSNTLLFGEQSRLTLCVRGGHIQGASSINDGSSNTILFGEGVSLQVNIGRVSPLAPISDIVDGTSNTILLGEIGTDFCLGDITIPNVPIIDGTSNTILIGEQTQFDLCAERVGTGGIVDGTSNTILIGETSNPLCYAGAGVTPTSPITAPPPSDSVPEPATLALVGLGLVALGLRRAHRGRPQRCST